MPALSVRNTMVAVGGASLESARRTQVYAHRQGAVADQYRFMFKGKYVEETHTPDDVRAIAAPLACWRSERLQLEPSHGHSFAPL